MKTAKHFTLIKIGLALLLLYGFYQISTFTIFDDAIEAVEHIPIPDKNYTIKVYHIPSNASSQSYIQVRKVQQGTEVVLHNFERYDYLKNYVLSRDSLALTVGNSVLSQLATKKIVLPAD